MTLEKKVLEISLSSFASLAFDQTPITWRVGALASNPPHDILLPPLLLAPTHRYAVELRVDTSTDGSDDHFSAGTRLSSIKQRLQELRILCRLWCSGPVLVSLDRTADDELVQLRTALDKSAEKSRAKRTKSSRDTYLAALQVATSVSTNSNLPQSSSQQPQQSSASGVMSPTSSRPTSSRALLSPSSSQIALLPPVLAAPLKLPSVIRNTPVLEPQEDTSQSQQQLWRQWMSSSLSQWISSSVINPFQSSRTVLNSAPPSPSSTTTSISAAAAAVPSSIDQSLDELATLLSQPMQLPFRTLAPSASLSSLAAALINVDTLSLSAWSDRVNDVLARLITTPSDSPAIHRVLQSVLETSLYATRFSQSLLQHCIERYGQPDPVSCDPEMFQAVLSAVDFCFAVTSWPLPVQPPSTTTASSLSLPNISQPRFAWPKSLRTLLQQIEDEHQSLVSLCYRHHSTLQGHYRCTVAALAAEAKLLLTTTPNLWESQQQVVSPRTPNKRPATTDRTRVIDQARVTFSGLNAWSHIQVPSHWIDSPFDDLLTDFRNFLTEEAKANRTKQPRPTAR